MSPASQPQSLLDLQRHLAELHAAARRAHEAALGADLQAVFLALRAASVRLGAAAELLDQLERVSGGCPLLGGS